LSAHHWEIALVGLCRIACAIVCGTVSASVAVHRYSYGEIGVCDLA
jgi:hypothetical protein